MAVDDGSIFEVHDEIQDLFDFYNQIDLELTNEIVHETDLQAILDICSRFFNNPLFIVDSGKKLIEQSSNLQDPEWEDVEQTGLPRIDVINQMIKTGLIERTRRQAENE